MAQSGNGKGIHVVSWRRITEQKVEEGLALHNLLIVKHSLKAKHVFNYLNSVDTIWVSIAHLKYGRLNFGKDAIPRNCSWFFKGLYQTTAVIKPFCWIKTVNPSITSLLYDPWCDEISLAFKPTFINMHLNYVSPTCSDLCNDNSWDQDCLYTLFGPHAYEIISRMGRIDHTFFNEWVWAPKSATHKIASTVYHFLNHNVSEPSPWAGWNKIWSLKVMPKVKTFFVVVV